MSPISTISLNMLTSICSLLFSTEVDVYTASKRDLLSVKSEIFMLLGDKQSISFNLALSRMQVSAASTASKHSADSV